MVARTESMRGPLRFWPWLCLLVPVALAGFTNPPKAWMTAGVAVPVALLAIWTLRSLSQMFRGDPEGPRRTVSGLLAGIVLVDLVALMPEPSPWGIAFLVLFGLALIFQRTVPAT